MSDETKKIFFSYARKDSDFALELAKKLRAKGADLWVDQLNILPSQLWDVAVQEALEACPRMLVVLSPNAVGSKTVMDEVWYAQDEKKQVIPVLYRPCKVPFHLRRVHYVDFTVDYDSSFEQLLIDLGIKPPGGKTKPSEPKRQVAPQPKSGTRDPLEKPEPKAAEIGQEPSVLRQPVNPKRTKQDSIRQNGARNQRREVQQRIPVKRILVSGVVGMVIIGIVWLFIEFSSGTNFTPDLMDIPVLNDTLYLQEGEPVRGGQGGVVNLAQGWNQDVQEYWYFTSQGSQIIPYDWFLHLEQAGNTKSLRTPDNMNRLGYLTQGPTTLNPDALPVGFVKDENDPDEPPGEWFGVTCAACHTGQIEFNGQAIRIDGGPTLGNFDRLIFVEILRSMEATLYDQDKFDRFATSVLGNNASPDSLSSLRARLESRTAFLQQRAVVNAVPDSLAGHGRFDMVNNMFNAVFGQDLTCPPPNNCPPEHQVNKPPNTAPANAPVSYPALWDAPYTDQVQWTGFVNNTPTGSVIRSLLEVLGVFATFTFDEDFERQGYQSSVRFIKQKWLEHWLRSLWSPKWPERYLGDISAADSAAGRSIYITYCISCHVILEDRTDPDREIVAEMRSLPLIGTDPLTAANFVNRASGLIRTGKIEGKKEKYIIGPDLGPETTGIQILVHAELGIITRKPKVLGSLMSSLGTLNVQEFDAKAYRARPLNGVWATAPFLHNGSVPNLWELLKVDTLRIDTFYVGSFEFDPVNVGYVTTMPPNGHATLFDTSLPGNSNAGHDYGVELSDADKRALIEYIKSL